MKINLLKNQNGSAMVTLLAFVATGIIVIAASVAISISNAKQTLDFSLGEETYQMSETGIETAILKLLRNPGYTGETLTIGGKNVTITVTGGTTKTIVSTVSNIDFKRTIQATVDTSNNKVTITDWKEIN